MNEKIYNQNQDLDFPIIIIKKLHIHIKKNGKYYINN